MFSCHGCFSPPQPPAPVPEINKETTKESARGPCPRKGAAFPSLSFQKSPEGPGRPPSTKPQPAVPVTHCGPSWPRPSRGSWFTETHTLSSRHRGRGSVQLEAEGATPLPPPGTQDTASLLLLPGTGLRVGCTSPPNLLGGCYPKGWPHAPPSQAPGPWFAAPAPRESRRPSSHVERPHGLPICPRPLLHRDFALLRPRSRSLDVLDTNLRPLRVRRPFPPVSAGGRPEEREAQGAQKGRGHRARKGQVPRGWV